MTSIIRMMFANCFVTWQWFSIYFCSLVAFFTIWILYLQDFWKSIFADNLTLHFVLTATIDIGISISFAIIASMIEYGLYGERQTKSEK